MPVKLASPRYETFELTETDKEYGTPGDAPTTVTIKQALRHESDMRDRLFAKVERRWSEDDADQTIRVVQEIAMVDVHAKEAFLTMVECNLLGPDGEPLFRSRKGKNGHPELDMSESQFMKAWGSLFPEIGLEIIKKVHAVNLRWAGPLGEGA